MLAIVIACAALPPVIGSDIRTWRSAHEATRNISRFRAKHVALDNIEKRLEKGQLKDSAEAESLLRDLWCAEQIMESVLFWAALGLEARFWTAGETPAGRFWSYECNGDFSAN